MTAWCISNFRKMAENSFVPRNKIATTKAFANAPIAPTAINKGFLTTAFRSIY